MKPLSCLLAFAILIALLSLQSACDDRPNSVRNVNTNAPAASNNTVVVANPYDGIRLDSTVLAVLTNKSNLSADEAMKVAVHYQFAESKLDLAIKYYEVAAAKGEGVAAYNLGQIYSTIFSVQDMTKAQEWYSRAAELGDEQGARKLRDMKEGRPPN